MHTPLSVNNVSNCLQYPWHPSVVYVKEGWNGHKWWMAQTPFPPFNLEPYRDRFELPCIHFSDDGIRWEPVPNNPIEELTNEEIEAHNYYSDPHLIFKDGRMELYYRFTFLKDRQLIGNKTLLLKRSMGDGFQWSDREVVADLRKQEDVEVWGEQIISQALVWREGKYRCYYVNKSSYLTSRQILFTDSQDGHDWTKYKEIELNGGNIDPWHIDMQFYDGKYQMIVYDMNRLVWFESEDGIHFDFVSEILRPSSRRYDFYADGLYRACSVKVNDEILVYFSANRKKNTYIGLLSTCDRQHFKPINGESIMKWLPVIWKPLLKSIVKQ